MQEAATLDKEEEEEAAAALELPRSLRLQSLRATDSNATEFILRLQHKYAVGEDPELSKPARVDLAAILKALAPDAKAFSPTEATLDGAQSVAAMRTRRRFPTVVGEEGGREMEVGRKEHEDEAVVTIQPMELRTWRVRLAA